MALRWALLVILLLAFGLRLFHLGSQSLWADEGNSAFMTGRSVPQILEAAAGDIHPPLYYLALRGWSALGGISEFGLRFPSAAFGLLLVAVLYALGARLFSPRVGILAGFLGALSPPLVYYSQEMRMYSLVALAAALSFYWFWRLLQGDGGWAWLGYVATSALGLYTHYSFVAVLLVENLAFVLWRWRVWRHRGSWLWWLATQGVLFLFFLPWLVRVWDQLRVWQSGGEAVGAGAMLGRLFDYWAFGPAAARGWPLAWLLVGLAGAAWLGFLTWPRGRSALALIGLCLVAPTAGLLALSASRPVSDPKQLFLLTPAFLLVLSLGANSLSRALALGREPWGGMMAAGLGLAAALAFLGPLGAIYSDPGLARDDYRGLVALIEASASPQDAIILDAAGQTEVFNYYYRGDLAQYPLPRSRPLDRAATEAELAEIGASHQNLWLVLWADREADPQGVIQGWLNAHAYRSQSRWFGNVLLVRYRQGLTTTEGQVPVNLSFGSGVELVGYRLEDGPVSPGQTLGVVLLWRGQGPLATRYKVFAHLQDSRGHIYAQHDAEPQGGSRPTTSWSPGKVVTDGHGLTLAWGTPPGIYDVVIGLYDPQTGQRLEVMSPRPGDEATAVRLAQVEVWKARPFPPPQVLNPQQPVQLTFGPVQLLGYDLTLRGEEAPRQSFAPGQVAALTLYWQAQQAPSEDLPLTLRLLDNEGKVAWEEVGPPAGYSTSAWEAGELVQDEHWIPLSLAPGRYGLALAWGHESPKEIGHLEVKG